jgi:glycosyltransferase involved in cell wall biosynthesis
MRVALIAPPWLPVPPPAYGGIESMLDQLARGLREAGHDILLCATRDSTCPVPRTGVLPRADPLRLGVAVPELRHVVHAYAAARDCDLVHDHTMCGPLYAAWQGVPTLTTNHGPFDHDLGDIYRAVSARVPVIAISHAQAARARGVRLAGVIHHGVDPADFPFGTGDGGHLLFLGRMAPEKGAERAARAARRAGLPLLLAGRLREPLERTYFEDRVRPLLGGGVEYIGEVGGQRKLDVLAGARALVNPIRWPEPFGLVMIEALACGTPVLAFREGAAPEIVEHGVTGFLSGTVEELAGQLGRIDELDRRACRAAVEGHFSSRRMVAEHLALYERHLAGHLLLAGARGD